MAEPTEIELEDFRENWMTELAIKKSDSEQKSVELPSNRLSQNQIRASGSVDQLTKSLSQSSLGPAAPPTSSSSSPSRKGKEKDETAPKSVKEQAIDAYIAGSRYERFVLRSYLTENE
jgi:hypothetical protein